MEQMEVQLRAMALDLATKTGAKGAEVIDTAKLILAFLKGE